MCVCFVCVLVCAGARVCVCARMGAHVRAHMRVLVRRLGEHAHVCRASSPSVDMGHARDVEAPATAADFSLSVDGNNFGTFSTSWCRTSSLRSPSCRSPPRPPEFNVEHRRAHRASALVMKVAILFPFSQTPLHQRKWPTAKPNWLPNIDRGGARGGAPVN